MPEPLAAGVIRYEARAWRTNSLAVDQTGLTVIVDPAFDDAEIAEIAEHRRGRGGDALVLVTHHHYDHVCGIGAFPDATVLTEPRTRDLVADGTADEGLREARTEWGVRWPWTVRVDALAQVGRTVPTAGVLAIIDTAGHAADGVAFVIAGPSGDVMLVAGDYLSSIAPPWILWDVTAARASVERLAVAADDVDVVVPGHGPALARDAALRIAEQDLAYLDALLREPEAARPPRPSQGDFARQDVHAQNVARATS
jgi:hydroxyacylglutathione hydrolase